MANCRFPNEDRPFCYCHPVLTGLLLLIGLLLFTAAAYSLLAQRFLFPYDFTVQENLTADFKDMPEWLVLFWDVLAAVGSIGPTVIAIILAVIWVRRKCFERFFLVLISYGGGLLLFIALSFLFNRERPDLPGLLSTLAFPSFPSGHMIQATTLTLPLLALFLPGMKSPGKRAAVLALALLYFPLIAYNRVVTNAHYLTDVLAGFGIGLFWAILVLLVFEYRQLKRQ